MSEDNGGAISFTQGDYHTVKDCTFTGCSSSSAFDISTGGGGVFSNTGSSFSVISSTFISCSTTSLGGGLLCTTGCASSFVSECFFLRCSSETCGGGMSTHCGPISAVSSSYFVSCTAHWTGGGLYHNSVYTSSHIMISNLLFNKNTAESGDPSTRGGGGFGDFRDATYSSMYSFCFYTGNIAPPEDPQDISVRTNPIDVTKIQHCFTTTASNTFLNHGSYVDTWLPMNNAILKVFDLPSTAIQLFTHTKTHLHCSFR